MHSYRKLSQCYSSSYNSAWNVYIKVILKTAQAILIVEHVRFCILDFSVFLNDMLNFPSSKSFLLFFRSCCFVLLCFIFLWEFNSHWGKKKKSTSLSQYLVVLNITLLTGASGNSARFHVQLLKHIALSFLY